jgi:hypothetical protein
MGGDVIVPSEILNVHGPVPVKFMVTLVSEPLQIVEVPEMVAVGPGVTVILIGAEVLTHPEDDVRTVNVAL